MEAKHLQFLNMMDQQVSAYYHLFDSLEVGGGIWASQMVDTIIKKVKEQIQNHITIWLLSLLMGKLGIWFCNTITRAAAESPLASTVMVYRTVEIYQGYTINEGLNLVLHYILRNQMAGFKSVKCSLYLYS